MTNAEYKALCKNNDYKKARTEYFNTYLIIASILYCVGSLLWCLRDWFRYNQVIFYTPVTLAARVLPFIFLPICIFFIKKFPKLGACCAYLEVWTGLLSTIWLYNNYQSRGVVNPGDGWLIYYTIFFAISLGHEGVFSYVINILIFSITLIASEKFGYLSFMTELNALKVCIDGVISSSMLALVSIVLKKIFAMYYQTKLYFENISKIDPLTKCYNRSIIKEITDENGFVKDKQGTIIILDIDSFKSINTEHGHVFGDKAIADSAVAIKKSLRKNDITIRYGGDEFAIYASTIIDPDVFFVRLNYNKPKYAECKITYSVGMYHFEEGEKFYDAIDKADKLLYEVKNSTKNGILSN